MACFIRLSKVLSLCRFAITEISGIKHLMEVKKIKRSTMTLWRVMHVDVSSSIVESCISFMFGYTALMKGTIFAVFVFYRAGVVFF